MISPCRFRAVETATVRTPEDFEATLRTYAPSGPRRLEPFVWARKSAPRRQRSSRSTQTSSRGSSSTTLRSRRGRRRATTPSASASTGSGSRCERGLLARDLVHMQDEVQNELLAIRIDYRGESMPLRNAHAKLAVLDEYARSRGAGRDPRRRHGDDERAAARASLVRRTLMKVELTGIEDPVLRSRGRQGHLAPPAGRCGRRGQRAGRGLLRRPARPVARPPARNGPPGDAVLLSRGLRPEAVAARRHVSEGARGRGVPRYAERPRLRPGR